MMLPEAHTLWSSVPVPAFLVGADGRTAAVNPAGEEFLNASARALIGQPLFDRLAVDAPLEEAFARMREGLSTLFINDVEVGTGDRPPVLCNIQAAPLIDAPDMFLLLVSPREFADRLGRAQGLTKSARSAIGMADMLAHEIKNPLAGIAGAAQLLAMNLRAEDAELTDLIVAETRRIVKLLEQVEQFGQMRPPDRHAVNIHDVLDRARRLAQLGFASDMRIIEDFDPSLPPVLADADQLTQVFLNLLKNAAEAADGRGGTIRIRSFYDLTLRLRREDGARALPVQVEIVDDGPGIPPAMLDDIFDPFVSGRENGTGLGLALVSRIIADHDGWIGVDSQPGRTSFRIALPKATDKAPAEPEKQKEA
jgi:two-component system, NtrC family, nitrogen regulation sensor histidine kinase GlnL